MHAHRQILLFSLLLALLALPVSLALAAASSPQSAVAAPPAVTGGALAARAPAAQLTSLRRAHRRHERAVLRLLRVTRTHARLTHHRRPRRATYAGWSTPRLSDHARATRRAVRDLRAAGGAPAIAIPAALHAIAACESGGNPAAVDSSGTYRGLFQFDRGTWASVGGSGDPAAAPALEQYRRAAMLYARSGASPWPVCGR